jgi:D-alanyl-D-alanine carboxypeptidase
MALLSLAIQDRFPKYYPYFAIRSFTWRGVAIGNHNKLLGRVDGVDGIKTGYTRASGFNLVTSVNRGNRQIVAVVLGGRTGAARDELMRDLIAENIRHARVGPRTAPRFAETPVPMPPRNPAVGRTAQPAPGSAEPVQRRPVRTVAVAKGGELVAEGDGDKSDAVLAISTLSAESVREPIRVTPMALAPDGKLVTFAPPPPPPPVASASAQSSPEIERAQVASTLKQETPPTARAAAATAVSEISDSTPTASVARGSWIIQIGAFAREEQARDRLNEARAIAAPILAKGNPYTEKSSKGRSEIYRARFAGFDEASAKRACETLKKNDFNCFAARN